MSITGFIFGEIPTPEEMEQARLEERSKIKKYNDFRNSMDMLIKVMKNFGYSVDDVMNAVNRFSSCYFHNKPFPKYMYIVKYNWLTGMDVEKREIKEI